MRVVIALLPVLSASPLLVACGDDDAGQTGTAFWPLEFETIWPEVRDCRLSPAEHDGHWIRVFTNPEVKQAYLDGDYPFASGAQLVKGEYRDEACTELVRVSGMLKLEVGTASEFGDWNWQRAAADGALLSETSPRSCIGCHASCLASDYACTDP